MAHRIVLVSQWYPPEQAPYGHMVRELAAGLAAAGWEVTVVTGFPNHPGGEVFGGYRKRWRLEERESGVRILRTWLATSSRRSRLSRVLGFVTFTFTSAWTVLWHTRADVIFGVTQPLSMGVVLPLLARLKRAAVVLNIQDLHPDVPIELGMVRNPILIRALRALERFGYRAADRLTVISEGFREHCVQRGGNTERIHVIHNWIDLDEVRPGPRINRFRSDAGCSAGDFIVLYAGTVGLVSGAEILVEAAKALRNYPDIKFVVVGGGPLLEPLRQLAAAAGLGLINFFPFQDRSRLGEVQAAADVSVVTLASGKGRTSVPSKLLGYMAAARPVIAAVDQDCETARTVSEAGCGVVTPPGDGMALAAAILRLKENSGERQRMGLSGRRYAEEHLSRPRVLAQYGEVFALCLG
jgi:colanic acid biosynthesis glycosyl transferase WcaI